MILIEDNKMRQIVASLILAVSILSLAACSNGGNSFVPSSQAGATHTTQGFGGGGFH
jgi:predicted small lipoprotein YifL